MLFSGLHYPKFDVAESASRADFADGERLAANVAEQLLSYARLHRWLEVDLDWSPLQSLRARKRYSTAW